MLIKTKQKLCNVDLGYCTYCNFCSNGDIMEGITKLKVNINDTHTKLR